MIKHTANTEHRRFLRHPMCFPLTYSVISDNSPYTGNEKHSTTINISRAGLLFTAKYPAETNTSILIKMPFKNKIFNIKAKVVRCHKNEKIKLYEIGVCFPRIDDAFTVRLIEQMYLIKEYQELHNSKSGKRISLQEASKQWIKRHAKDFQKQYW